MNALKKAAALLIALTMLLGMTVLASAATSITAPNNDNVYKIYQIMKGDYDADSGKLSNLEWGENAVTGKTGAVSETDLNTLMDLDGEDDVTINAGVEAFVNLDGTPKYTATKGATVTVEPGYYIIVDDGPVEDLTGYSLNIVQVVGEINITPKNGTVEFDKKLKDKNDTTGDVTDWQDSADYDIGDVIPFRLRAKIASDYDNYKTYYLAFHDEEEDTLEFQSVSSVEIYRDGAAVKTLVKDVDYTVVTSDLDDNCTFEVILSELKNTEAEAGDEIIVEYTSKLTDNAVHGKPGNVNKAKLEYSNNPNNEQNGSTKPETDETPWDSVIVFTYKVVIDKVDEDDNALDMAGFSLFKKVKNATGTGTDEKLVKAYTPAENQTQFEFKGLDDGDYILRETATPSGYNDMDDVEFTISASHDDTWETQLREAILTALNGSVADGSVTFAVPENDKNLTTLSTKVVNKSGIQLPTTGGMGTTVIYICGAALVLVAGVLLIAKRRMKSE